MVRDEPVVAEESFLLQKYERGIRRLGDGIRMWLRSRLIVMEGAQSSAHARRAREYSQGNRKLGEHSRASMHSTTIGKTSSVALNGQDQSWTRQAGLLHTANDTQT